MSRSRPDHALQSSVLHVGLIAGYVFFSAACGGARQVEPLPNAVREYNDAVRWQRFDVAAARLPATQRDAFLDLRDRLQDDLRINDYEVIRVRYDSTESQARVHVKLTWHLDSRGIVHDTHAVQTWRRQDNAWMLARETYLRGEPMPGLASSTKGAGKPAGSKAPARQEDAPADVADPADTQTLRKEGTPERPDDVLPQPEE